MQRIALIVDDDSLSRFELDVVNAVAPCAGLHIFSCTNTARRRDLKRHLLYYVLNLFTIRNRLTRSVSVDQARHPLLSRMRFDSLIDGAWQSLPVDVIDEIVKLRPDVILKFGMTLLRVPDAATLPVPILSYHHGDPDQYRGRPAGFYELLHGAGSMGQIVQILSNRLDAGQVVAFADTRTLAHSYRATLMEAYRHSPLLINKAIANARAGTHLDKPCTGRNYRLPGTAQVIRFVAQRWWRTLRHLAYGAFWEKRWNVSLASATPATSGIGEDTPTLPPPAQWTTLPVRAPYNFLADPFLDADGAVLAEALNRWTGKGELVRVTADGQTVLASHGGHYSYPFPIEDDGEYYIVPEIAGWSAPMAWALQDGAMRDPFALDVEEGTRLIDPTLFRHQGQLYLFASRAQDGAGALHLWVADGLRSRFNRHPASPICVSAHGARMGGAIIEQAGRLFRLGQDASGGYGDGLFLFEIATLSPHAYSETRTATLRFTALRGPHTLGFRGGQAVFDWYRDRFSLFAGVRRVIGRFAARR